MEAALHTQEVQLLLSHSIYYEPGEGILFEAVIGDPDGEAEAVATFALTDHIVGITQLLRESGDYRTAYAVGHELSMYGEDLLALAEMMDDGLNSSMGLFDLEDGDLNA